MPSASYCTLDQCCIIPEMDPYAWLPIMAAATAPNPIKLSLPPGTTLTLLTVVSLYLYVVPRMSQKHAVNDGGSQSGFQRWRLHLSLHAIAAGMRPNKSSTPYVPA